MIPLASLSLQTEHAMSITAGPHPRATAPSPSSTAKRGEAGEERPDRTRLIIAIAVVLGVMFRSLQYFSNRSLWLDEALLAPGILEPSFMELLDPARWGPVPPGYLLLTKVSVLLLGDGELALRLVPLLASLAALPVFWAVARRCVGYNASVAALALFAVSPYLIYYASELKPYSSDVLAALLLTWLALEISERGVTWKSAAAWALAGIVAAGFSLTSVFVTGGATIALLLQAWRARDPRAAGQVVAAGVVWGLTLGVPYLLFLAGKAQNEYLQAFWQSGFMPFPPRSLEELAWFPQTLIRVFEDPLGVLINAEQSPNAFQTAAGILAFAVGLFWVGRQKKIAFFILCMPILLTLLASGLHKYPFGGHWSSGGRLLLFLVPAFFILMGAGVEALRTSPVRYLRPVGLALAAMLLLPPLAWGVTAVPIARAELKPVLGYARSNWQPGDLLYVHYDSRHTFRYYAPRYGFEPGEYVQGGCARFEPQKYLTAMNELAGRPRVWVLFTGGKGAYGFDEKGFILKYLDHIGTRLDDRVSYNTSIYLYDLRPTTRSTAPYEVQLPTMPRDLAQGCALWG